MRVNIAVDITDEHWAALAEVADARGVKLSDLLGVEVRYGLMRLCPQFRPTRPHATRAVRGDTRQPGDGRNPYHRSSPFPEGDSRRDIVESMWKSGHSTAQIARMLGGETKYRSKVGATIWAMGYDTGIPFLRRPLAEVSNG